MVRGWVAGSVLQACCYLAGRPVSTSSHTLGTVAFLWNAAWCSCSRAGTRLTLWHRGLHVAPKLVASPQLSCLSVMPTSLRQAGHGTLLCLQVAGTLCYCMTSSKLCGGSAGQLAATCCPCLTPQMPSACGKRLWMASGSSWLSRERAHGRCWLVQ